MNEDFLHYIWKFKCLATKLYQAKNGLTIEVINFGIHNKFSGPDFKNATIRYDGLLHAGHVEMHLNSSDWYKHGHDSDPNYDNVVLHVVYNHDQEVVINGRLLPTIELKDQPVQSILDVYNRKFLNEDISCKKLLKDINPILWRSQIDAMVVNRLTRKLSENVQLLQLLEGNYAKLLDVLIGRALGGPVNKEGFELLVETYPSNIISKLEQHIKAYEQLFLGLAGFELKNADKSRFDYWSYYANLYHLVPLPKTVWKYGRLMPNGFPHVRVKQFASMLTLRKEIISGVYDQIDYRSWIELLSSNNAVKNERNISRAMARNIIINAILPFHDVICYRKTGELDFEYHMSILELVSAEQNSIIQKWKSNGVEVKNALESQSLIELYNEYCVKKQCLNCKFGVTFMAR